MKLRLKNFQSISNADIEIGPLTVLVGQSDIGKSAVIRALYLLHRNQGGLELVKHGSAKLAVEQELEDGTKVSILKGKGVNSYFVNEKSFSKIGRDIPVEVLDLLRTSELPLDKDLSLDLNFSLQFDHPFLLADSTSIITKAISSLSGINIIYSAIREGSAEAQKLKTKSEILSGTVSELIKYDKFSEEIGQLSLDFSKIKKLDEEISNAKLQISKNINLLKQLESLENRDVDLAPFKELVEQLGRTEHDFMSTKSNVLLMNNIVDRFSHISNYALSSEFSLDLDCFDNSVGKLQYTFDALVAEQMALTKHTHLLFEIEELEDLGLSADKVLKEQEAEILTLKAQVKVCELCQRPF